MFNLMAVLNNIKDNTNCSTTPENNFFPNDAYLNEEVLTDLCIRSIFCEKQSCGIEDIPKKKQKTIKELTMEAFYEDSNKR